MGWCAALRHSRRSAAPFRLAFRSVHAATCRNLCNGDRDIAIWSNFGVLEDQSQVSSELYVDKIAGSSTKVVSFQGFRLGGIELRGTVVEGRCQMDYFSLRILCQWEKAAGTIGTST